MRVPKANHRSYFTQREDEIIARISMRITTLHRLFRFKAWANDALLTALSQLSPDSPIIGLAIPALSHTYVVDQIFSAHLRGETHSYASANPDEMPTLAELSADLRASDREYVAYVGLLDHEQLDEMIDFTFTDGAPARMTREEILLHIITHGVGHRGQVNAVFWLNSLRPPIDGFTTYLHQSEGNSRRRGAVAA
jgi:uncharacterized damage-inducible protein DinB